MWPILKEACLLPWNHRHHFGRLLIIPTILSTLIGIASIYWFEGKETSFTVAITGFLLSFPDFMVLTFFAVSCHRSVLLGDLSVNRFGVPGWSMRETRFFLWLLGIYILGSFLTILSGAGYAMAVLAIGKLGRTIGLIDSILDKFPFFYTLMGLMLVLFAYLVGRLSLVLPAVAVDLRPSVNPSWSQTKGNGWRVAVLVGGIPILFLALEALFGIALDKLTGISRTEGVQWLGVYSIATSGLGSFLRYVLATVEVAILSLTFKELSGWQSGTE